jgi:hypothetical protein
MKAAASKTGLTLVVALASVCVIAASAQAVTITPAGTAVSGTATGPALTYGGTSITCNSSTAVGTTKSPASDAISLTLTFQGGCMIGILNATFSCPDSITLIASGAATSVTFNLDTGFTCTIFVIGVCNIDIEGPQNTGNTGTLNEATTVLTATVTVNATRTGAKVCGPASGVALFSASYNLTPTTLAIT